MEDDPGSIQRLFNQVLQALAIEKGEMFANKIRHILMINLERGRVHQYLDRNHAPQDYVAHVVTTYEVLHPKLDNLRQCRDATEWIFWVAQFETWAYNFFRCRGMLSDQALILAKDCATDTAVVVLTAHFPYDCDFEPWANVIVQNMCRNQWKQAKRQWDQAQNLVSLDDQVESRSNPLAEEPDHLIEQREQQRLHRKKLLAAVTLLSPKRQRVIQRHELDGIPLPDLAKEMGTSLNSIYSLHSRAMGDLRALLDDKAS